MQNRTFNHRIFAASNQNSFTREQEMASPRQPTLLPTGDRPTSHSGSERVSPVVKQPLPGSTEAGLRARAPSQNKAPARGTDHLARIFNTVLVSTQTTEHRDFSADLRELTESASYKVILNAVRQLASLQGISEQQASGEIIQTFRKLEKIWNNYIFREGLDRIRRPKDSAKHSS